MARRAKGKGASFQTILLDTGVLYALADKSDEHHLDARAIMLRCLKGEFGTPLIIDYCILETMTLLQQRRIPQSIETLMKFVRGNKFTLVFVTEKSFNEAVSLTIEKGKDSLSLTDCSQAVISKELQIGSIATFDSKLGSFFDNAVGNGSFDQLDEMERRLLKRKG